MLPSALLGGLFIGILSALPIINVANCCCIWMISGGALAAYLAQQNGVQPLTPGRGAQAGVLAGIVGAFVWLLVAPFVDALMAPLQQRMIESVLNNASDLPPGLREWFETLGDSSAAPLRYAAGFMFQLIAGSIFATLGGLLAAVFLRRDNVPPALGGPTPPPLPGTIPPQGH